VPACECGAERNKRPTSVDLTLPAWLRTITSPSKSGPRETRMPNDAARTDPKPSRKERGTLRRKMKDLLLLLPSLLALLVRLVRDPRVSRADKVILGGTILYVIAPLDFIPDMIPFIGQVDDSFLVAISLLRLMTRTDAKVIADHWHNSIDIKRLC